MGIIFLTISSKYAVAVFAMNAIHYLLKLFSQEQFDIAMDRAVKKVVYYDVISLSCVDGVYRVCISEIVGIGGYGYVDSLPKDKGIGIFSILAVCQKYDGNLEYKVEHGMLCLCIFESVIVPLKVQYVPNY